MLASNKGVASCFRFLGRVKGEHSDSKMTLLPKFGMGLHELSLLPCTLLLVKGYGCPARPSILLYQQPEAGSGNHATSPYYRHETQAY